MIAQSGLPVHLCAAPLNPVIGEGKKPHRKRQLHVALSGALRLPVADRDS
jgi:hypothetical protein